MIDGMVKQENSCAVKG